MTKTPLVGSLAAALAIAVVSVGIAAPAPDPADSARSDYKASMAGLNAWDGRRVAAGDEALASPPAGAQTWDDGAPGADSVRSAGDFSTDAEASRLANLTPQAGADALPLSQFAGEGAKSLAGHDSLSVWDFVNKVRYGRLPEPASWALMLIGFGMIGGALRGFVVANRRLARLQPEDTDID